METVAGWVRIAVWDAERGYWVWFGQTSRARYAFYLFLAAWGFYGAGAVVRTIYAHRLEWLECVILPRPHKETPGAPLGVGGPGVGGGVSNAGQGWGCRRRRRGRSRVLREWAVHSARPGYPSG